MLAELRITLFEQKCVLLPFKTLYMSILHLPINDRISSRGQLLVVFLLLTSVMITNQLQAQSPASASRIDSILQIMTLEEKAGQLSIFTNDWNADGTFILDQYAQKIKEGKAGGIFNAHGASYTRRLQQLSVDSSRLGIPLLFAFDVIHGHHTIFPIPLAEAASWDLKAIEHSAEVAAIESAATGLHWIFAPMCDISRDPRWGRVMEGAGEDVFLASAVAAARVRGFQGDGRFSKPDRVAACVKHFAAYGAPQAGREYHTVDMSERSLREVYLPPYKAAIDAGALSVMSAFNELNGVPATANPFLLKHLLRHEWNFEGVVVSDYTSVMELIHHGIAGDTTTAALAAFDGGTEIDMQADFYNEALPDLVKKGLIGMAAVDTAVRRVLSLKAQLGLFDNPYRFCSEESEKKSILHPDFLEASKQMALKSMVLLKNESVLPLSSSFQKIALIGPLAKSRQDMLGGWSAAGDGAQAESLYDGLSIYYKDDQLMYARGCEISGNDTSGFRQAVQMASLSDVVIMALGEAAWMTGEATSRSSIDLPGVQNELFNRLVATGKPIVVVLFNGRPLTITNVNNKAHSILEAWFPGSKAGSAIAEILIGKSNPSGKLPITFPKSVGQIPIHYDMKRTGRPWDGYTNTTSRYTDIDNEPLYPFGYGLSYSTFEYSDIRLSKPGFGKADSITASITVKNTGKVAGEEIVQLYIHDQVASVTRPVKELKGFQKIDLKPGESKVVTFLIEEETIQFLDNQFQPHAESGEFTLMIGKSSDDFQSTSFYYLK